MIKNVSELFSQRICSKKIRWKCRVYRTCSEEFFLCFETILNGYIINNVLLTPVFNAHVSVSKRDLLVFEHLTSIVTSIHDIDFGETSDRPLPWRIDFSHDLECFTCGEILICWDDTQYYRPFFRNVSQSHVFGDVVYIARLLSNGDGSDSWQVDDSESGTWLRVNIQQYWFIYNLLAFPTDLISHCVDRLSYFIEVCESLLYALLDYFIKLSIWSI